MVRVRLVRTRRRKRDATIIVPSDVAALLGKEAQGLDRECFWRIDLDSRNAVLDFEVVSVGSLTASLVHPREVFKGALLANAAGVIIVHNHPSRDSSPSLEDKETTRRLKQAGEILGIPLLDHVVLGDSKHFSFRESGLL